MFVGIFINLANRNEREGGSREILLSNKNLLWLRCNI
jgi:hypothetical protein